jgi:hypothetical protein
MLAESNWKRRVYALRVIGNTALYALTGCRLPGFVGETIYQSRRRLTREYGRAGLAVIEDRPAAQFLGSPVFIYHTLSKTPDSGRETNPAT